MKQNWVFKYKIISFRVLFLTFLLLLHFYSRTWTPLQGCFPPAQPTLTRGCKTILLNVCLYQSHSPKQPSVHEGPSPSALSSSSEGPISTLPHQALPVLDTCNPTPQMPSSHVSRERRPEARELSDSPSETTQQSWDQSPSPSPASLWCSPRNNARLPRCNWIICNTLLLITTNKSKSSYYFLM